MIAVTDMSQILACDALPVEYMRGTPRMELVSCAFGTRIEIEVPEGAEIVHASRYGPTRKIIIRKDEPESEAAFQEILLWMRRAGARLAKINRRLTKENVDWHGREKMEI